MPTQRDYYEILGLPRGASQDQIKRAYRKLARELHPDMNKADDAAGRFGEVQQAYDVLSDDTKRKTYDRFGHNGPSPFAGGGRGPSTYTWSNVAGRPDTGRDGFDIGSMFEDIFGQGRSSPFTTGSPFSSESHARTRSRPKPGRNIAQDLAIDFMTAATGGTRTLRVQRGGSTQSIEVTIPKAVGEGAKLRMRGVGAPSPTGGPPGDLILTVHIAPHPYFRREGDNVILELPVSITEAALGATIHVPTLAGKRAELTIPPATSSGTRLRLKGQGLTPVKGPPGDLLVSIKIVPPTKLSPDDRSALQALATHYPPVRADDHWID